ncbi:hypothetical protein [Pectinatus frisingensis]|uniref:hypothetical protein n=1 Tax=Pectinatus frisingensis TaxID=865 RepID=UPI0018C54730|nr:hypothetical protein [Pectinatus frisingensis]
MATVSFDRKIVLSKEYINKFMDALEGPTSGKLAAIDCHADIKRTETLLKKYLGKQSNACQLDNFDSARVATAHNKENT